MNKSHKISYGEPLTRTNQQQDIDFILKRPPPIITTYQPFTPTITRTTSIVNGNITPRAERVSISRSFSTPVVVSPTYCRAHAILTIRMGEHGLANVVPGLSESLRWRHNGRDSVSNHQPHDCLLKRLFRRRSKKTSKPRVTGLCVGNSPGTGDFPAQMASNAENVSIWWRHHV